MRLVTASAKLGHVPQEDYPEALQETLELFLQGVTDGWEPGRVVASKMTKRGLPRASGGAAAGGSSAPRGAAPGARRAPGRPHRRGRPSPSPAGRRGGAARGAMAANATTAGGGAALPPLSSEPGGVIHAMWIPCVVFAHVFAAFFLARMFAVMYPRAWASATRALTGRGRRSSTGHGLPAGKVASPRAGARASSDAGAAGKDQARVAPAPRVASGAPGPDDTPFRASNAFCDAGEDEELGLPAEDGSESGDGANGTVPSHTSELLMRRLTTQMRPMLLEWQDVGCSYSTPTGTKTVLKEVWGKASPGDMLALMGPSGAGKSTLMDILAGRKSVGTLTGAVLVNGAPRRQQDFARKTAYVPQDDNFMPTMTVSETCGYYATLTLPRGMAKAARRARIGEVLAAMGLSHTTDTLVGGTLPGGIVLRGLSGGERKRLSIATGIMSTPCVVFLDEPTSGLDSFAALSVMSYMRSMAAGGQTVVSSIHQPRAAIWALFDTAVLLSMGHLMYFGPREAMVPWFVGRGYPYDPALHGLASDWVMDLVNIGFKKPESLFGRMMNSLDELTTHADAFRKRYLAALPPSGPGAAAAAAAARSDDAQRAGDAGNGGQAAAMHKVLDAVEERGEGGGAVRGGLCGLGGAPRPPPTSATWFSQFRILLWRELLAVTRNPADVAGRCLIFCWLAVFVGLIYYNLPSAVDALRARLNVLFVEPVILLLLPYVYMSLFTSDKQYYIADSSAKLYHPSAYYVAKQLAVAPFAVLNVLLFSYTLYGLAGLRHSGAAVGMNGLMSVLIYLIAAQVLAFAAVVTPNQDVAFMLAIGWTAVNLLMSNFMVRYQDMSQAWFSQLRYISAMGFAFDGYAQAEFGGVSYSCAGGLAPSIVAFLPEFLPNTPAITSPLVLNQVNNPGPTCRVELGSILSYFDLFRPFWQTVVILRMRGAAPAASSRRRAAAALVPRAVAAVGAPAPAPTVEGVTAAVEALGCAMWAPPLLSGADIAAAGPRALLDGPLLTKDAGVLPLKPRNLGHALYNYGGYASKYVSVRVENVHVKLSSWDMAVAALADAEEARRPYWCSLIEQVQHPAWWPAGGHVPTYDQVIFGRGNASIGLHFDKDNACAGGTRTPVSTYLAICEGAKLTLLLPPGDTTLPPGGDPGLLLRPTRQLLDDVRAAGGYYFLLQDDGVPLPGAEWSGTALYMPAGGAARPPARRAAAAAAPRPAPRSAAGMAVPLAAPGEGVIYVALHEHNEAVALRSEALPADPEDVLNLLSSEAAPLLCWFDAAKAYLSQAQAQAFLDIVKEASSDETLAGIRAYFSREPTFERVQMLVAMAAYALEAARLEREAPRRTALMAQAEEHVRAAEALRSAEMLPAMARAALALARNDAAGAMVEYKRAEKLRHNGRVNHAPLLGQAALHYNAGDLAKAIGLYAQVLRANPQCPPEVRLGIAACYYRAGKLDAAAAAFNRVLALDPGCADALLGLAVIKFGSADAQEGLNAGLQLLQRAFAADQTHPGVLCALSHFSLLKGSNEQALELAQCALDAADTDRLRAVALGLLGRCHHALGNLAAAQHHYAQAIRLDAKAPLPHLGTAQVYLATGGDPTNAVSELELVLKALPGNGDALWLLGGLLPVLPARVAKTLAGHRDATARQVNDAGLQEMLGELLAATEPAAALAAFELALSVHRKRQQATAARNAARQRQRQRLAEQAAAGGPEAELTAELLVEVGEDEEVAPVPARLLNNAAVLKYRAGAVAEAAALMGEAAAAMMGDASTSAMQKVTLGYNMARLKEATGDLKSAGDTYKQLLQQFPGYIDCYLRLSAMAKAAGDDDEAQRWAAAATQQAGGHVDAQAMLACLHLERGDLNAARECVARVGGDARRDPYMQLTHANVVLAALPGDGRPGRSAAADRTRREYIYKALSMYRAVLKAQPDSIYAVNGLGTCLAELGHMAAAKAAFDEVIRATSKTKGFVVLPETYVNLGHVWLGRTAYGDALRMYEHASRLSNHKNATILLYMARAHHDAGDHLSAKRCLLKALHLSPGDVKLRFNLAFVLQEWAVKVFKRRYLPGDTDKLRDYEAAEAAFAEAEKIFNHLHALGKPSTRIEPKKLLMHSSFCAKQLPNAAQMVRQAQDEQLVAETQRRLRAAELAAAEAERRHREAADSAAKKAEQARKLAEAQRALEESRAKLDQLRAGAAPAPAEPPPDGDGGKAKRRRKKGGAGDDGADFYVGDDAPIERLPKARRDDDNDVRATLKRTGLDSDSDDDDAGAADVEGLFGSGGASDEEPYQPDADDDDAGDGGAPSGGGRGRLKRRAAAPPGGGGGEEEEEALADDSGGGEAAPGEAAGDGFEVDELFADEEEADGGGGQPRKRARQALESDDDEGGGGEAAAAAVDAEAAPPGENGGDVDAEMAPADAELEDLF
ncbi:ctr9 [Scenedesmus sp. PABB004]|nr:ctr9 [Scenedesmus sp. PABB004]